MLKSNRSVFFFCLSPKLPKFATIKLELLFDYFGKVNQMIWLYMAENKRTKYSVSSYEIRLTGKIMGLKF